MGRPIYLLNRTGNFRNWPTSSNALTDQKVYHLRPVSGLRVPDWMAVAAAILFFNEHMRLYLPLSVGLAFKEPHGAAGNWRRLLIHH